MKLEGYWFAILFAALLAFVLVEIAFNAPETAGVEELELPEATATKSPAPTISPTPTIPELDMLIAARTDCVICHENPAERIGHVNGEQFCNKCHDSSDLHNLHSENLCETCHGETPEIPEISDVGGRCGGCHGFPDPMEPSFGNIITIHENRETHCVDCHIGDIFLVHEKGLEN